LEATPWSEEEDEEEYATLVSATLAGGSPDTFIAEVPFFRASGGDDGDESLAAAGGWLFAANGFSELNCSCCCMGFTAATFVFTAEAVRSTIEPSIKGSAVTAGAADDDDDDDNDDDDNDDDDNKETAAAAAPPLCAVTSTDNFPAVATPKRVKAAEPMGPNGAFRVSTKVSNEAPEVSGPLDSTLNKNRKERSEQVLVRNRYQKRESAVTRSSY